MVRKFQTKFTVKFREGDPAQIMYFANLFSIAHDAFEEFIVAAGYAWKDWFRKGDVIIPIRHVESNFLIPFKPGETYDIAVTVAQIKDTSFQMKYVFSQGTKTHAQLTMVHAVVDSQTSQKTAIPAQVRERLTPFLEASV